MSRLFILGAGFSRNAGIPLASEMTDHVISMVTRNGKVDDFASIVSLIRKASTTEHLDIEHLFELGWNYKELVASLKQIGTAKESAESSEGRIALFLDEARLQLHKLICTTEKNASRDYISEFAENLVARDVIATFNYDTLVERSLTEQKAAWCHRLADHIVDSVHVLKMHGSVDWLLHREGDSPPDLPHTVLLKSNQNALDEAGSRHTLYRVEGQDAIDHVSRTVRANSRRLGMSTLGGRKPIATIPGLGHIWAHLHTYLRVVQEVYIVGFSFSQLDPLPRLLISNAIQERGEPIPHVALIDPNADKIATTASKLFDTRVYTCCNYCHEADWSRLKEWTTEMATRS